MQVKKNPNIEIGRNSSLYFAIGLNIMLFLTWRALEYKTYEKTEVEIDIVNVEKEAEEEIPLLQINTPPPPPPPPAVLTEDVQIVEDVQEVEETVMESTESSQEDKISEYSAVGVGDVAVTEVEEEVEVPFAIIEDAPIFPGCEGLGKMERRACFERKVQEHVVENFHYPDLAKELGIQGRVFVMFTIDKSGNIIRIKTRGPDKSLENEAARIIGSLPKMTPGKQRGKPVQVPFAVPINFTLALN